MASNRIAGAPKGRHFRLCIERVQEMRSDHLKGRKLAVRCCHGACFAIGFLLAALFASVMFWIVWCYLGLSIVQVSDSQRRALVNYSPITSSPLNRTELPSIESSANAISRSATTTPARSFNSPLLSHKEKDSDRTHATALAKGDFADRNRGNVTGRIPEGTRITQSHGETPQVDEKKAIVDEKDDIHLRRVSTDNHQQDARVEKPDISPTHAYDYEVKNSPRNDDSARDDRKPPPREYSSSSLPRRDEIQSSRRSSPELSYREPDFEREYPRSTSRDRGRGDADDIRGSRSRYDTRDRGRDTDDKFSKGDTRVYPDEDRDKRPVGDDRYISRDTYDAKERGDDDRYRHDDDDRRRDRYDDRYREDRRRDRDDDERRRDRDYVYRDDSRYKAEDRSRDERYPEGSYKSIHDEDRNRDRTYEDRRYADRDDEYRYHPHVDEDRNKERGYDDRRYVNRDDEKRYRDDVRRRDEEYRYPSSSSRSKDLPPLDRRPPVARQNSSDRDDGRVYESPVRDRSRTYDPVESRSRSQEDRYIDDDYRRPPSRYDDRDRIAPTRVRDDSKSSPLVSRDYESDGRTRVRSSSRTYDRYPVEEERRYSDDRVRGTSYYDDEDRRTGNSRIISSPAVVGSENSRRSLEDREYRTRLSDERKPDGKYSDSRKEVVLDQRSYASDGASDFRKDNSRTRPLHDYDRDDDRYPIRQGDEEYVRRSRPAEDDEYRPREDYDVDRPRYSDGNERYPSRKYDRLPVDERPRRRDPDDIDPRKESSPRDRRYHPGDIEDRPSRSHPDDDHRHTSRHAYNNRPPKTLQRDPQIEPAGSRVSGSAIPRDKRLQTADRTMNPEDKIEPERPLSPQDVIEAAQRHADATDQNRKVYYPVFDPRASNLTSPEIIRPNERRGTTLMSRRRRGTVGQ